MKQAHEDTLRAGVEGSVLLSSFAAYPLLPQLPAQRNLTRARDLEDAVLGHDSLERNPLAWVPGDLLATSRAAPENENFISG